MISYGPASKYYDLFGSKKDIAFYRELAIQQGRNALELGVGTGRVAIELAKAGVAVLGIDSSKYMLAVAREKLRKEDFVIRKLVKLKLGDMCNFKVEESFSLVYIASSTFEHCVTREDQHKCLKNTYEALNKGGVLAFDISQPSKEKEKSWNIDRKQLNKEIEVVRTIFSTLNLQTSIVSMNLFFDIYKKGKLKDRYHEYSDVKISSKKEVMEMLKTSGFILKRIYSNFDKSKYSKESEKIIFVSAKQ